MNLINFVTILFKHKNKIIVIALTIIAVVTIGTLLQKPVYEAKAVILVKMLKEETSRPTMGGESNTLQLNLSQDELINTEIQTLTGRELAEKVIRTLQLENIYPHLAASHANRAVLMDQAVLIFGKSLKVMGVRKSNVINLSFQHNRPDIAAKAVNLLVDAFKDKHLALHSDPQSSFISSELSSFESKLKESEKNLQDYQQRNNVFSLEEQRSLLLKQRSDFDSSYKITLDNVSELNKKIASLRSQLKAVASSNTRYTHTERDNIIVGAKSKLLELQLKEQELRRKYTDHNRLVVDAKREVETVNQFLKDQEEGIVGKVKTGNPVYQNIEVDLFRSEADLNSQNAKAAALKGQLRQLDREIASLDMSESTIQNMKRQVSINEKNYKTYADRHEDARISDAMNKMKLSNISIIQAAEVPVSPIKPKKKMNILLGVLLGIASGLACAYLSENIAQTFTDPESVEKYLELPVLLTVSSKEG
jgi:uncharacterized protein involved in exopolysaccharide biosynthesis